MKRTIATAFFAVASLLTAGSVSAQNRAVQANIPFSFAVGNTVLPAGTYTVSSFSSQTPQMILIRNKDHARLVSIVMTSAGDARYAGDGYLVFHRYGERYFLNQVLCPAAAIMADLPNSKREDRARTREASLDQPDRVLLALR
ncbi:MAG TPA: hypothetical protein VIY53_19650 [Acidobacteriaceae bacterium]